MKCGPQIFKITEHDVEDNLNGLEITPHPYAWDTIQEIEACCNSILQCDVQKRAELNSSLVEGDIRHCVCENKFRECLTNSNPQVENFGQHYFMKTAKCYSVDHPIVKCEQYKCYYQPNATYDQYPSGHASEAVRCTEYELDKSKPKMCQTFNLPFYYVGWSGSDYQWIKFEAKHDDNGNLK